MISGISSAFAGMQGASRLFDQSATQLAGAGAGSADTVTAVVNTLAAQNSFEMNTAVLRSALDMQKQVLDIMV